MGTFVVLIRGINVGGKNKVSMAELKFHLEESGYENIQTYINSGNIILKSDRESAEIESDIEAQLPKWFKLKSGLLKVLVISDNKLTSIVKSKPANFGNEPDKYHSDVIFLIDIDVDQAFSIFDPREGIDTVWKGDGVIYSRRLSAERTKSRLNKIMSSTLYKSMTIRNWKTTNKLYEIVKQSLLAK